MRFCLAPEINRAKSRTGIAGEEFGDLSPAETNSPDGMGTGFVQTELNQKRHPHFAECSECGDAIATKATFSQG